MLTPRFCPDLSALASPSEVAARGFHVFRGVFIKDENSLLRAIESTAPAWVDYIFRKTKNYGPAYNLFRRRFLFGERAPKQIPLPSYATDIVLPRLQSLTTLLKEFKPNQLAVSLYKVPGESHILPHNDCENGNIATAVVGVCLAGACTMTLILRSRYSGVGHDIKKDIRLPPGTVYVMSGDALRIWEHAIFPGRTEATRYSLTFRDVSPRDSGNFAPPQPTRKERFKQSLLK
ncbi:2OG-Fe(II) oxygenase [Gracilaria domingensis]|nr:2OG-Fe(II) oxygenase [Gracilaria domingensis]